MRGTSHVVCLVVVAAVFLCGRNGVCAYEATPALYSWDYSSGLRGPDHWIEVVGPEATARCGNHNQSPIDLLKALSTRVPKFPMVNLRYKPTPVRLESKMYTVQLNYEPGSTLEHDGVTYNLEYARFHVPSEHTYMGERAAMEIQFVHRIPGGTNDYAIVSVLVDEGPSNTEIRKFIKCIPGTLANGHIESEAVILPELLFPHETPVENKEFFHYTGSITTPDCNDNVPWWVMKKHITSSKAELDFFRSTIHWPNTRNLQPLWNRKIVLSDQITYWWLEGEPTSCETCPCSEFQPVRTCPPPPTIWSYANMDAWSTLNPEYILCTEGQHQSPITFSNNTRDPVFPNPGLPSIINNYKYVDSTLMNTGNGLIVLFDKQKPGFMKFMSKQYDLIQFHFHAPAEHSIEGTPGPLEVQMVHMSKEGRFSIVSVLFKFGAKNMFLDSFLNLFKEGRSCGEKKLNPGDLLPLLPHYITYEGSLTTPPCSEGVRWFVMKQELEVSADQVARVKQVLGHSARPMWPTNNRMIYSSVLAENANEKLEEAKADEPSPDPFDNIK